MYFRADGGGGGHHVAGLNRPIGGVALAPHTPRDLKTETAWSLRYEQLSDRNVVLIRAKEVVPHRVHS